MTTAPPISIIGVTIFAHNDTSFPELPWRLLIILAEIANKLLTENPVLSLQYGVTEGYAPLKEKIKESEAYLDKELNKTLSKTDEIAELTALKILKNLSVRKVLPLLFLCPMIKKSIHIELFLFVFMS